MTGEDGEFGPWEADAEPCARCGGRVQVRVWVADADGREVECFRCVDCKHWWDDEVEER